MKKKDDQMLPEAPRVETVDAAKLVAEEPKLPPLPAQPSIGRVVHYKLRTSDVMQIRDLRVAGPHSGNDHREGQILPAVIVQVWNTDGSLNAGACNIKVMVDAATRDLWITSATRGDKAGQWDWPARV